MKALFKRKLPIVIVVVSLVIVAAIVLSIILIGGHKQQPDSVVSGGDDPFSIDTGYKKPEITLDGKLEEAEWKELPEYIFGDSVKATVKAFYGKSGVCFGAVVSDSDLWASSQSVYDNSSFEVYLDTKGLGGASPQSDHIQIFIDAAEQVLTRRGEKSLWVNSEIIKNYAVSIDGTLGDSVPDKGYTVELFVPYSQIGGEPQADYGIAFGLVECEDGTRGAWNGIPGVDVHNPDTYFTFYRDTNSVEQKRKENRAEISIDGFDTDAPWSGKSSYTFGDGGHGSVKSFFGDKGVYFFFDMKDSAVIHDGKTPHLNDSVEVYLDTLKNGGTVPKFDDYQFRADVGGNIAALRHNGQEWAEMNHSVFSGSKTLKTDNGDVGYTIELFIPWTDIGFTEQPSSMKVNFGTVNYDGKKAADGSREVSWSGTGGDPQVPDNYLTLNPNGAEGVVASNVNPEIKLDGIFDESAWKGVPDPFTYSDGRADVRWIWTEKGCYLGFDISDANLKTDGKMPFENSSVEVYLDYKFDKGSPKADDRTILIDASGKVLVRKGNGNIYEDISAHAVLSGVKKSSGGYTAEVFVPWSEFGGGKPSKMGAAFAHVAYNTELQKTEWFGDGCCADPQKPDLYSVFTAASFGAEAYQPSFVIDGKANESIWNIPVFTFGKNNEALVRTFMDSAGIGLFFEVIDTDVWAKSAKIHENDSIEIYLDTQNNKGMSPQTDDYQLRLDVSGTMICLKGTGQTPAWEDSKKLAWYKVLIDGTINGGQTDKKYTAEIFIPWSALGMISCPEKIGINFGLASSTDGAFDGWNGTGYDPQKPESYFVLDKNTIRRG